jgi:hypothetical protein
MMSMSTLVRPPADRRALGAMVDHTCYVWLNLGQKFDEDALLAALTTAWARAIGVDAWSPARSAR